MEPQERYPVGGVAHLAVHSAATGSGVVALENSAVTPSSGSGAASGNESVAVATRELAGIGARPLAEHADAFGRVHAALQQALSEIDDT